MTYTTLIPMCYIQMQHHSDTEIIVCFWLKIFSIKLVRDCSGQHFFFFSQAFISEAAAVQEVGKLAANWHVSSLTPGSWKRVFRQNIAPCITSGEYIGF